ncbi:DUF2341 domain-containing protein [Marinilongibacter aquaticus]|uniref:DUF2341 domain-containing protein n=1 Tax=Marinilongibacter aquaticus TaxID=2975157 RepID=UPI0021BDD220|nr:DUF2341 domain-containing protein [Marinilongibacter aquaticus]UBM59498.1 DUF2341 domain-containing protein [Marinilongibacter aquaticus]
MKQNLLPLVLMCLLMNTVQAQPFGYNYGKEIVIQSSQVSGSTDLTDFPVLVSLTDSDLRSTTNGGHVENTAGFDIIFTTSDCSVPLEHEIEKYTASTGQYIAWVKIPSLSTSVNTTIHMYYGNSSIASDPSTTSVWSNGFIGVWHMSEAPSGTAPQVLESTSNGFNLSSKGSMTTSDLVSAKIGDGIDFDGVNDGLLLVDNSPTDILLDVGTNDLTLSAWVRVNNLNGADFKEIINKKFGQTDTEGYGFRVVGSRLQIAYKAAGQTNTVASSSSPISIPVSTWIYATATFNVAGDIATTYVNGVAEPSIPINAGNSIANDADFHIGSRETTYWMAGRIDEARTATVLRSGDWIKTEYNNQNSPGTFYTVATEMPATTLCSALPVKLINFQALPNADYTVEVSWQTAGEIDNDFFTIERSKNGSDWESIAEVPGSGNSSSTLHYFHLDEKPLWGISYYRLKQTDFNGQFTYSQVRPVHMSKEQTIVFPNPTQDVLSIVGPHTELMNIRVKNTLGQDLGTLVKIKQISELQVEVDMKALPSGLYYIATKTKTHKVYKK